MLSCCSFIYKRVGKKLECLDSLDCWRFGVQRKGEIWWFMHLSAAESSLNILFLDLITKHIPAFSFCLHLPQSKSVFSLNWNPVRLCSAASVWLTKTKKHCSSFHSEHLLLRTKALGWPFCASTEFYCHSCSLVSPFWATSGNKTAWRKELKNIKIVKLCLQLTFTKVSPLYTAPKLIHFVPLYPVLQMQMACWESPPR